MSCRDQAADRNGESGIAAKRVLRLRYNLHQGQVVLIKRCFRQPLRRIAIVWRGRVEAGRFTGCQFRFLTCRECPVLQRDGSGGAVIC
jgi:hypothetical protein